MTRVAGNVIGFLYRLYAFTFFTGCLLLISPGILVAVFMGQPSGGNLVIRLSRWWSNTWLFLIGIKHANIYEGIPEAGKPYVFVANHISYLDIPLIFKAIERDRLRILGKHEMKNIPVFGTLYSLATVMVDRSNPEKRAQSVAQLKRAVGENFSIFLFPEGTFNETGRPLKPFFDGAFRIAIETATPLVPVVFLDALQLMHYDSIWRLRPGTSRAVILPEVPVEGLTMDDLPALRQKVFDMMETAILQYQTKDAG